MRRGLAGLFGDARRRFAAACALVVFAGGVLAAGAGAATGTGSGDVVQVRFGGDARATRVVVELSRSASGRLIDSGGQPSLVLALPGVEVREPLSGRGVGLVRDYQLDTAAGAARLRLALNRPAEVRRRFLLPPGDGVSVYRYVIDLEAPADAPTTTAAARPAPPPVQPAARPARPERRVIVIDPGHGGRDPGTLGGEVQEKSVVLAAAQELQQRLERTGRYRVVLTRSDDTYVPHARRVEIARAAGADLFISLHADSSPNPETRGASVYTLSDRGADRAAREALGDSAAFRDLALPGRDPAVRRVLLDLTQRATMNRSSVFAHALLAELGREAPLLARSHRDQNFAVLLAPDVPAVLLEMGFVTNPDDRRILTEAASRGRLMQAVATAIDAYFAQPAVGMIAAAP